MGGESLLLGRQYLGRSYYKLSPFEGAVAVAVRIVNVEGVNKEAEQAAQADLVRDLFATTNQPVPIDTALLAWREKEVAKLAQTIYQDRAFDRLPILGDALEKAGCNNQDVLNHCRSSGPHVRG